MKTLLLCLMFFSTFSFAEEEFLFRDDDVLKENITQSQWVMFLGAELLRLKAIPTFTFDRKILDKRTKTLYGPTLGFARKWYLLGNLTTTTEPMVYYLQSKKNQVELPTDESVADYRVSEFQETNQFYGLRLAQSLGYTFEFESFYLEPFAQIYVGQGYGRSKITYHWDTQIASEHEEYVSTIHENITHQGFSAGVQVINRNGYMSFFKASKNTLTYHRRKSSTYSDRAGVTSETSADEKLNEDIDKFTFTLGLGYIF